MSLAPCLQETKLQFIILLPFFNVVVGTNLPSEINESFALFDNNTVCRWVAPSVYTEEAFPFDPDGLVFPQRSGQGEGRCPTHWRLKMKRDRRCRCCRISVATVPPLPESHCKYADHVRQS